MERNTDINSVLFDVELRPVAYSVDDDCDLQGPSNFEGVGRYKAVVRKDNGSVFAIVSDRYEILHNSRALELGKQAFELLFPESNQEDFRVYDIKTTKTGSACHIDLIHKSYDVKVWEQESWLPFLRISNSYNRSRALSFDFGFVRKLCSNGLIFQKESIRARYYHTRGKLSIDLQSDTRFDRLKELEAAFSGHMKSLRARKVGEQFQLPLSLYLLGLEFDLDSNDLEKLEREHKRFDDVKSELKRLIHDYFKDLGGSAYTALNIATDFATHSASKAGPFAKVEKLQAVVGSCSRGFEKEVSRGSKVEDVLKSQIALLAD